MAIFRANAKTFNNEDKIVEVMDRMGEFNPLQLTCEDILNFKKCQVFIDGYWDYYHPYAVPQSASVPLN